MTLDLLPDRYAIHRAVRGVIHDVTHEEAAYVETTCGPCLATTAVCAVLTALDASVDEMADALAALRYMRHIDRVALGQEEPCDDEWCDDE